MQRVMKRVFRLFALVALMSTALVACQTADLEDLNPTEQVKLTGVEICASIDNTRVELGDDTGSTTEIYWCENDAIIITVGDADYTFHIRNFAPNQTAASFYCDAAPETLAAGTYKARYEATTTREQSGLKADLHNYQPMSAEFTVAEGEGWSDVALSFHSEVAIIKLTLSHDSFKGQDVSNVRLINNGYAMVSSTASIKGDETTGAVVVYFAVKPQKFIGTFVEASCNYKEFGSAVLSDNTMTAGKLYRVTRDMGQKTSLLGPTKGIDGARYEVYTYANSIEQIDDYGVNYPLTLTFTGTPPEYVNKIGDYKFNGMYTFPFSSSPWTQENEQTYIFGSDRHLIYNYIKYIKISDGSIQTIGKYIFSGIRAIEAISIPPSVTTICKQGEGLYSCRSIHISNFEKWCQINFETECAMPLHDTYFMTDRHLILNGEVITDVVIPESITEIKQYSFMHISDLQTITIHENVESIGTKALYNDFSANLKVYCKATTPPTLGNNVFYKSLPGLKIYVPQDCVETYKNHEDWSEYNSLIEGYVF